LVCLVARNPLSFSPFLPSNFKERYEVGSIKTLQGVQFTFRRLPKLQWKYVAGGVFAVLMGLQLLYPADRLLPRAYLGQVPVGMKTKETIRGELLVRREQAVIEHNGRTTAFDPLAAGIDIDIEKTLADLPSLKWPERIVPLWPYLKTIQKNTSSPVITRDEAKIAAFAASLARDLHREPVNASAEIKDGQLHIKEAEDGEEYAADSIEQALITGDPFSGPPIRLEPQTTPAAMRAEAFEPLKQRFSALTDQPLKIKYGDTVKEVDSNTVASWLKIAQDPGTTPQLSLNLDALEPVIAEWNKEYAVAPGITQVQIVDNVERTRKAGVSGRSLHTEAVKNQLAEWVKQPSGEQVVLASRTLPPKTVITRTYSQSSTGLLAKLKQWINTHPGSYQVAIRELGGQGREASYNVAQQTVMASTYKTFLAFVAYNQAESGALNLNTALINGKNIEQCIEVMIVNSDNDCAVALGRYIGWAKADRIIAAHGFSGVRLNNYDSSGRLSGDKLVNAREQASFLAQLSAGSLINRTNTARLLGYMKRQIYRQGIPAGSQGAVVADKVGFLDGYLHDVGIVYSPKATYALVIMSEGSSWASISNLSRAVYDFMNE
jgi:beta-lactamase class A